MQNIDLMIIGAQKAGTTSLKNYLGEHPEICTHERTEFKFFVNEEEYKQGYKKIFKKYYKNCRNKNKIIGKNVLLMYNVNALKRLYEYNPNIKLVIILRNPIDRTYSAWLYEKRKGRDQSSTFEEAINLKHLFDSNYYNMYIEYSLYYKYISKILEIFDRNQIKIFLFEKFKENPIFICQEIFSWLDVDKNFVPNTNKIYNKAAIARFSFITDLIYKDNTVKRIAKKILPHSIRFKMSQILLKLNEKAIAPPKMNKSTREILKEFFKIPNKQLSELLKLDLSLWGE